MISLYFLPRYLVFNMDLLDFFYGFGLMVLGLAIFIYSQQNSFFRLSKVIWLLGLFAIIRGAKVWMSMWIILMRAHLFFSINLFFWLTLIVSNLLLLEFGRQLFNLSMEDSEYPLNRFHIGDWLTPLLGSIVLTTDILLGHFTQDGLIAERWLIGLPACALSALGFRFYCQSIHKRCMHLKLRPYFFLTTVSLILYGILQSYGMRLYNITNLEIDSFVSSPIPPEVLLQFGKAVSIMILAYAIIHILRKFYHEMIHVLGDANVKLTDQSNIQSAMSQILRISLKPLSLQYQLQEILELLMNLPWLAVEKKGSIHLSEIKDGKLSLAMKVQIGLDSALCETCRIIPFGFCLCGRAAEDQCLIFKSHLDQEHDIHFSGMGDHGHYCVPVISNGLVLGVINLYLPVGYQRHESDVMFLSGVADALAGIIERKQAEQDLRHLNANLESRVVERTEALRLSEDRYRTIFDHANDAIFVHDMNGQFLDANVVACHQLGYSHEALLRMFVSEINASSTLAQFDEDLEHLRTHGFLIYETTHLAKDGTLIPREISANLIQYLGIPAVVIVARDITERKQIELMKEQFLQTVSHELRTPLTSIMGYLDFLLTEHSGHLNEAQRKMIETVLRNSKVLAELINNLLDLSKLEAGEMTLHPSPINITETLRKVLTSFDLQVRDKPVRLEHQVEISSGMEIIVDEQKLERVLRNLISNAIKFTPEGEIRVEIRQVESKLNIIIRDTGVGIPLEAQEYIFEKFRQVDNSISRKVDGTGLGLPISKKLTELLGGTLSVWSQPGQGSVFTVELPIGSTPRLRDPDIGY